MATMCNIKITDGRDTYFLYRHWDGYPAETGAHVLEVAETVSQMKGWNKGIAAVNKFFRYLREDIQGEMKSHYELTDNVHGDIEHFYHIQFYYDKYVIIGYSKGYGPELEYTTKTYNIQGFRDIVNADRMAINKNLEGLKESNPAYADYEPYPMV